MKKNLEPKDLVGCTVKCSGISAEIAEVVSASNYGKNGGCSWVEADDDWYIEFKDTNGVARYWKQGEDGGELIVPEKPSSSYYPKWKQLKDLVEYIMANAESMGETVTLLKYHMQQELSEIWGMNWEWYTEDNPDVDEIMRQLKQALLKETGDDFDKLPMICMECGNVLTEDYEKHFDTCKHCLGSIADSGC